MDGVAPGAPTPAEEADGEVAVEDDDEEEEVGAVTPAPLEPGWLVRPGRILATAADSAAPAISEPTAR